MCNSKHVPQSPKSPNTVIQPPQSLNPDALDPQPLQNLHSRSLKNTINPPAVSQSSEVATVQLDGRKRAIDMQAAAKKATI